MCTQRTGRTETTDARYTGATAFRLAETGPEQVAEGVGRQAPVDAFDHAGVGVAEHRREDRRLDAGGAEPGRRGPAEVVRRQRLEPSGAARGGQLAADVAPRPEERPGLVADDAEDVLEQRAHPADDRHARAGGPRLLGLGPADPDDAGDEVDVDAARTERLGPAGACREDEADVGAAVGEERVDERLGVDAAPEHAGPRAILDRPADRHDGGDVGDELAAALGDAERGAERGELLTDGAPARALFEPGRHVPIDEGRVDRRERRLGAEQAAKVPGLRAVHRDRAGGAASLAPVDQQSFEGRSERGRVRGCVSRISGFPFESSSGEFGCAPIRTPRRFEVPPLRRVVERAPPNSAAFVESQAASVIRAM